MLTVVTPDEALSMIEKEFSPLADFIESVALNEAAGRVLAQDVVAGEYVPGFDRSTVDGYALRARDTFGCSEAIPAVLTLGGEVTMGTGSALELKAGECCTVPTGGSLPKGADCAVMLEHTESYGDGSVGIFKPAAPGQNVIYRGDDVYPGKPVLAKGRVLSAQDIGALAAIGRARVSVTKRLRVGIISTGDELVPPDVRPTEGRVRDVNAPMLAAQLGLFGALPVELGIVRDDETALLEAVGRASESCDAVILSGGSSVGAKDSACRVIASLGEVLLHGLAMKPGKPTIIGRRGAVPIVCLPGHPVAAYFVSRILVLPLLARLEGRVMPRFTVSALLTESVSANHGREQYVCTRLERRDGVLYAHPIRSKSGLITQLAGADGFFSVGRDCEGLPEGARVEVTITVGE